MGVWVWEGKGQERSETTPRRARTRQEFFSAAARSHRRRGSFSILARTFPFCVAIHSTSYGSAPRPVCCAAEGGRRRAVRCQGRQARARDALGDARCGPFENRSVVRDVRERVLFPGTHRRLQRFERLRGRALRVSVPDRRERERREKRDRTLHRARHGVPLDMPPSAGGTRREKSHV